MRQRLAALMLTGLLALLALPAATAAAECQFILGFATLKALIDAAEGPDKVGDCLENQRFNPENGDALQQTTGGLLVWRKADNWTAFTDGYRTWINGPHGLQARLNTETFEWEGPATPPALTVEQLKNAEYQTDIYGKVRLEDGEYSKWYPDRINLEDVAFGDLNGDGVDDAAVILRFFSAGATGFSAESFYLTAVINKQGQPQSIVSGYFLGENTLSHSRHSISWATTERYKIESLDIQDGRIVVRMLIRGPSEPKDRPDREAIPIFRLEGDTLTREVGDDTGSWVQYDPYTDPLTDAKIIGIRLQSYDHAEAHLSVSCGYNLPEGRASDLLVAIDWGTYLGSDELEVLTRFDKSELQRDQWTVSTAPNEATIAPWSAERTLLWYMVNASSLVEPVSNLAARVVKHDGTRITAQWRIDGFPAASRPLAEHCYLPGY